MRKRILAAIAIAAFITSLSGIANAGPNMCDIMYKIGVRNVRECENPSS